MARIFSRDPDVKKFTWDFAEDGGAIGQISLGNLPEGMIVEKMHIYVETAPVGGGTITIGDAGDLDGFQGDMDALAAGSLTRATGALLDDYLVPSGDTEVFIDIATAGYTAGKIHFYFKGYSIDE